MLYNIPVNKIEKLEKIIKKAQKKGGNISFEIRGEVICDGTLYIEDPMTHTYAKRPIKVKCNEVFVDGKYIIDGWRFVGTIEHTKLGNIIRLADSSFEGKIPTKYNTTGPVCEHCGTIRSRKDTYLIFNDAGGEFKQVGKSCLLDYTRGMDADVCADIMSSLSKIIELSNCEFSDGEFHTFESSNFGYDMNSVRAIAIGLVKARGYVKNKTSAEFSDIINGRKNEFSNDDYHDVKFASDEEIEDVNNFAESITDEYGYMRNAKLAWMNDFCEYRDIPLVLSFVNTYIKQKAIETQNRAKSKSEYVGNIGDKVEINIKSYRVLFQSSFEVAWRVYAVSYTYEIVDDNNNVFILKSSKDLTIDASGREIVPVKIVATIKGFKEFRGIKQTVIQRFKHLVVE